MKRLSLRRVTALVILGGLFLCITRPSLRAQAQATRNAKDSAVYRLIEKDYTVKPDGSYTLITHVVVHVLNYKGKKDHADFKYSYNTSTQSVEVLEARTLRADGKSIPVTDKEIHDINAPEDARATLYSQQRVKVVNFPSVEPGTTVEIRLRVKSRKGFWAMECFRLPDPVVRKVVRVTLPVGMKLTVKLPRLKLERKESWKGKTVTYRYEARNVPRRVQEPGLPPIENRGTCLFLTTLASWKEAARFFAGTLSTPGLSAGVDPFMEKTPDDLYEALMKRFIPYPIDYFHTALSFQAPAETLKKGYGSSIDLAILFYHLLKKRGLSPSYLAANTARTFLAPFKDTPLPPLFDDVMVRCQGKDYAFYAKDLPPGYTGLQGKRVLDLSEGALTPSRIHYPNREVSRLLLTPTGAFDLEGKFKTTSEGSRAVETRSWLRYMTRDEWRIAALQILHDIDPLARSLGEISRKGLNTLAAPVVLEGKFKIPCQFPGSGQFTYIHLEGPSLPLRLETLSENRRGPFMVDRMLTSDTEIRITLPAGMKVCYAPPASKGRMKVMDWSVGVKEGANGFTFHRVIRLKRGILYPGTKEYHDFITAIRRLYAPYNSVAILEKK